MELYNEEEKGIMTVLLEKGYMILMDGKPVLTAKMTKLLGDQLPPEPVQTVIVKEKPTTQSSNYKEIWNKFIEDAEIPHRVSSPNGGTYTIRQYSLSNAQKLARIIKDPEVDYSTLVASTKNYYKTVDYKSILSNYIQKDIWKGEYVAWESRNQLGRMSPGENRWES